MTLWTRADALFFAALGHLISRGIAGMPLLPKPRVILHGSARTETAKPTVTVGAAYVASMFCQIVDPGLPFMLPAAFMDAAWAPQPDLLMALVREVSRHLAWIEGWVPHALYELVVGMSQRFIPLLVEPLACNRICKCYG
jgi:hypothetical protein